MSVLLATPVEIRWHSGLPIFSSEQYLKGVSDEYGWIGGIEENGKMACILPYTILKRIGSRMARFPIETIPLRDSVDVDEERLFLKNASDFLRTIGGDIIIPATTNAIFRTYPAGADAAPYGSYVIDLCQPEEVLWCKIDRITRQNINTAQRSGVCIRSGIEHFDVAYHLIKDTFRRSQLQFMSYKSLKRYVFELGENGKILVAEYQGVIHSCVIFAFSNYCAYAVYGGNISRQHQGANKLLHWEAIRSFKRCEVQRYDFVGARINPEGGSKQAALEAFKRHFGGKLKQGYMWKYPLRPIKSLVYSLGVHLLRGGDIVDNERYKLSTACHDAGNPI